MPGVREQVRKARRRLALQRFVSLAPWTIFWLLLAAIAAAAAPKVWPIEVSPLGWPLLWIGGAAVGGFLLALVGSWLTRRGVLDAAIEIDRRCGLRERLSSSIALDDAERDSEMGRALLEDAARRAERVDVVDRFRIATSWQAGLPLLAAAAALAVAFLVPDARDRAVASSTDADVRKQIEKSAEELRKEMTRRRKQAQDDGLKDAERIFREIEEGIDKLQKEPPGNRQQALIQLNDLAKELERRREQLGTPEQLRRRFERLRNTGSGPAQKLVEALRRGDLQTAQNQLEAIKEQLQKEELSDQEKQELAKQLAEMADRLREANEARQQAAGDLERQIREAEQAGDLASASRLQEQLNELLQQSSDMSRMQQMSEMLSQSAQSLEEGDSEAAASTLDQLSAALDEMESELDESEALGDAMTQIAQAKQSMNCSECRGAG